MHLINKSMVAAVLLILLFGLVMPGSASEVTIAQGAQPVAPFSDAPSRVKASGLDLVVTVDAMFPTGSLGLPGEPITWVISVQNTGTVIGTDLLLTNRLRDELEIDTVFAQTGEVAVSEQMVVYTLDELAPGDRVVVTVYSLVRRGPPNGKLQNQAVVVANGPVGPVSRTATAEVFVPSGLPPTGYPPAGNVPGQDAVPFGVLVLIAAAAVALTSYYVYRRGSQV